MVIAIDFRFAAMYNSLWVDWVQIYEKNLNYHENPEDIQTYNKQFNTPDKVNMFLNKIRLWWKEEGTSILKEMIAVTGLEWRAPQLNCYIITENHAFSDPLTMHCIDDKNKFIDLLTHELIHNLIGDNLEKVKPITEYIFKKYKDEEVITVYHVWLYAIHSHIFLKLYGEKRLKAHFNNIIDPPYKRAIKLVQEKGHVKILSEFKKMII
jgi:hypothetical protein